jgi:hypothetical protein
MIIVFRRWYGTNSASVLKTSECTADMCRDEISFLRVEWRCTSSPRMSSTWSTRATKSLWILAAAVAPQYFLTRTDVA